ncbi:MAG: dihydroorotate dehydrogenase 2 [Chloroflexi bacterium]|nr:dihydroorotate dehydrogenase 2 [Chloroflexota bacterium]MYK61434.1 dihydroorotate dehydrogenase 2 [Chloroflexota bacterium]
MYKRLVRPLLFSLDEEQSHTLSEYALQVPLVWKALGAQSRSGDPALKTNIAGIELPSPIGLAAGYDKNCRVLKSLIDLGFGFVCGGTITLAERSGNPPRRMVRIPESDALLNSLGFPGEGLARIRPRLARLGRYRSQTFASISGSIEEQIAECYRTITPLVAGIELNISSPNTVGLRVFHDPARLRDLVELLRKSETRSTPLLVKLPPWTNEPDERRTALALAETAVNSGADGLVIANTVPVEDGRLAVGKGGLSGAPLLNNTERMTAEVAALLGKHASIVSCGGISEPEHVWRMLAAGASAVQLYTGMVYEGPALPGQLNRGLLTLMESQGIKSLTDISGPPPY